MNVLSLFDGISCCRVALERAGISVDKYYASEIDKYAMKVAQKNYPDIIQLGDINNWRKWDIDWSSIDLITAGSPCQGFSNAGKRLNFDDPRSGLFFVFVDILNHVRNLNPNIKFLLENVKMKEEWIDVISKWVNIEPVLINSALVSAQQRKRLYWTNIAKITQPQDKHIYLKDILLDEDSVGCEVKNQGKDICKINTEKSQTLLARDYKGFGNQSMTGVFEPICANNYNEKNFVSEKICVAQRGRYMPDGSTKQQLEPRYDGKTNSLTTVQKDNMIIKPIRIGQIGKGSQGDRIYSIVGKSVSLSANGGGMGAKTGLYKIDLPDGDYVVRKLHPIECERLQTLPDNYTDGISNSQRYKCLGNGWTVDVISHIFSFLK